MMEILRYYIKVFFYRLLSSFDNKCYIKFKKYEKLIQNSKLREHLLKELTNMDLTILISRQMSRYWLWRWLYFNVSHIMRNQMEE